MKYGIVEMDVIENNVNLICVNRKWTNDGIIVCIDGIDEWLTNICIQKYPAEFKWCHYMNGRVYIFNQIKYVI
jgi:hypothetical protein